MSFKTLVHTAVNYIAGLVFSIFTMIALAAMEYISVVEASSKKEELLILVATAAAIWSTMFILNIFVKSLFGSFSVDILFLLLISMGIGYLASSVANFTADFFGYGMLSFKDTDEARIVAGLLLLVISVASNNLAQRTANSLPTNVLVPDNKP